MRKLQAKMHKSPFWQVHAHSPSLMQAPVPAHIAAQIVDAELELYGVVWKTMRSEDSKQAEARFNRGERII